ncbi:hypothetical protein [Rhodopseudomonas sp. P2A-2r]|uniref:hypothetical protein n=1 Tax=unclassified Rhodopseudomonas TaxID=2638247 RepID=UPI0022343D32|nr:hypothetical protein [Rhodopseudomonas sp. P2A-2r]UZE47372.1 hypothetical protein ONR75_20745 [Rhodopseudomonas sp. P2A-2r]
MKRVLIFALVFPPLVLLAAITATQMWREGIPGFGFFASLFLIAYSLLVIPAGLIAAVDWALSSQPLYLRLIATMPVAAFLVEYVAAMLGQPAFDIPMAIAGAVPAAVCSWLADEVMRRAAA